MSDRHQPPEVWRWRDTPTTAGILLAYMHIKLPFELEHAHWPHRNLLQQNHNENNNDDDDNSSRTKAAGFCGSFNILQSKFVVFWGFFCQTCTREKNIVRSNQTTIAKVPLPPPALKIIFIHAGIQFINPSFLLRDKKHHI